MRILVGTLYTIENEFEECCRSIQQQSHQDFEHFVIRNKPNKEAHDELYRTFMNRADEFDLFAKVDADMVIHDKELFTKIIQKFSENENMEMLTVKVSDFFTGKLMHGMHVFRSSVRWVPDNENVFVDPVPVDKHKQYKAHDLEGKVTHCENPSPLQAFRFGLHRAIKLLSAIESSNEIQILKQTQNIRSTWRHFRKTLDQRQGLACIAMELVLSGHIDFRQQNYADATAERLLQQYQNFSAPELIGACQELHVRHLACWRFAKYVQVLVKNTPTSIWRRLVNGRVLGVLMA